MKRLLPILISLVINHPSVGQEIWHILWLSAEPVIVDDEPLSVDGEFRQDALIRWTNPKQAMKVYGLTSLHQYVITAEAIPSKKEGRLRDYIDISQKLSTRNATWAHNCESGCFHYIGYEMNGSIYTIRPSYGMWMDEMPDELWLCKYDPITKKSELETKDFRSYLDALKVTNALVGRLLHETDHDDETYLILICQFLEERYRSIPLTMDELKIFVSLKY